MAINANSPNDLWRPTLKASPARVRKNERVILTVTFPIEAWPEAWQKQIYSHYNYEFTINNQQLPTQPTKNANQRWMTAPPGLADGDFEIVVKLTPRRGSARDAAKFTKTFEDAKNGGYWDWDTPAFDPNQPLSAYASISLASHQFDANVTMQRTLSERTEDQALWAAIRNRTAAVAFPRYQRFIDHVLCHDLRQVTPGRKVEAYLDSLGGQDYQQVAHQDYKLSVFGPYAYSLLKLATQAFLTLECGVIPRESDGFDTDGLFEPEHEEIRFNEPLITLDDIRHRLQMYLDMGHGALPYLDRIVDAFVSLDKERPVAQVLPYCDGILKHRLTAPSMIELIWSYWLEEGMLVQTMNAIAWRFQNRRSSAKDPLGELEFDALRPLNNVIWGFIQDEHNRLTVQRRAYEYQHHYGMSLEGKAVVGMTPADTRSKFIEAFHNLLHRTDLFYGEDRDTTKIADAFPLLNALKEVHLILAEGAHNQFGDLTWTARAEMLTMQWMLARPEMREFLRGRYMVPYQELWMGAVDSMKKLQDWTDTSIMHFYELAVTGERILLSIRYGDWADIKNIEEQAKNWARGCKPEVQRYLHAYRTVTGVDLSADVTDKQGASRRLSQPSALLKERLLSQNASMAPIAAPRPLRGLTAPAPISGELPAPEPARLSKHS